MPDKGGRELRRVVTEVLRPYTVKEGAVARICNAYNERWRTYHFGGHILGMRKGTVGLGLPEVVLNPLSLLIIYHDVWMKIGRKPVGENERRSARIAMDDLASSKNPNWLERFLWEGITATIDHTLDAVHEDFKSIVAILLDLDLWGLGQSPAYFQANTEAIWLEYEPMATREEYDAGRKKWAATFLERPRIYHTAYFAHLEAQARTNLQALVG